LKPRSPVDVSRGWNHSSFLGPHGISKRHERRGIRALEIFAHGFFENRRRKGPKRLAVLNAPVENLFHFGPSRIGKNASVAKRPWTPFDATLKPANHFAGGDVISGCSKQFLFAKFLDALTLIRRANAVNRTSNLLRGEFRPPSCVLHDEFPRTS
jgi:hypothetical protein